MCMFFLFKCCILFGFKVTFSNSLDYRTRMNGMLIHGGLTKDGVFTQLYRDTSNAESCSVYRDYGDSVCDDVILIPITSQQTFRYLKISAKIVTLCEVQVFAGKCYVLHAKATLTVTNCNYWSLTTRGVQ